MDSEYERETLEFDVLFVGGGPANLAGVIHLLHLSKERNLDLEVGLIEKGSSLGAHSLSGAILDPVALKELIPDFADRACPIEGVQCRDKLYYLTDNRAFPFPVTPGFLHNDGCVIISLSKFTAWLGQQAEMLGANIFPGFTGVEALIESQDSRVVGVRIGDKGIGRDGKRKPNFEPGIDIRAKVTVFGEGTKGSLLRDIDKKLGLSQDCQPQIFKTAIKETIEIPETSPFLSSETTVIHTMGYPLFSEATGGGFLYKLENNRVSLGLVVGLDYETPTFEPYEAFLRYKLHPLIRDIIKGGKVLQQGAKTLPAGGYYTIPKLSMNGALIVGDSAALLNTQRLKGIHTAMKSGILAAETIVSAFEKTDFSAQILSGYEDKIKGSWIKTELFRARNFSQAMAKKGVSRIWHLAAQQLSNGRGIVDPMKVHEDCNSFNKHNSNSGTTSPCVKTQPDGILFIDKLTGVFLSGTIHDEDQPCHLVIHDTEVCRLKCAPLYDYPCTRFCPGGVYELLGNASGEKILQLKPSNCLHCKTCEIKDPFGNISWTCPEGGGGPAYSIV